MFKYSFSGDDPDFMIVPLKKDVPNTGSLNLSDINLTDQPILRSGFIGALGIQEQHNNSAKTPTG